MFLSLRVSSLIHSSGSRDAISHARAIGLRRRNAPFPVALCPTSAAISAQRDVILSLNIDIGMLSDELKCSLYA